VANKNIKMPNSKINIIGHSSVPSVGIRKGCVINIKKASEVVRESVKIATNMAGVKIDKATVSISHAYVKGFKSSAIKNIVDKDIHTKDIRKVIESAVSNAEITKNYTPIQLIPYNFKVDGHPNIEDPNEMSGSRIETDIYIIAAETTMVDNIKKVLHDAGIVVNNFVLDVYASSISILENEDRQYGNIIIDLGGSISSVAINRHNSICYSDFVSMGSLNITNDLAFMFKVGMSVSEKIKLEYPSIKPIDDDEIIKIPNTHNIRKKRVIEIIYARVEEILKHIKIKLDSNNNTKGKTASDVILSGGMSKINGIKELASSIFEAPVKIKVPNIDNFPTLENELYSVVHGLTLYEATIFTKYEIGYNTHMKYTAPREIKDEFSSIPKLNDTNLDKLEKDTKIQEPSPQLNIGLSDVDNKGLFEKIIVWFKNSF
jgi:cell division protein FtsA